MKRLIKLVLLTLFVGHIITGDVCIKNSYLTENPITAITAIVGEKQNLEVSGIVIFFQRVPDEPVFVDGNITGLPPGKHGFHISESGDMTTGCYVSGNHLNPHHFNHGAPSDKIRQVGSLGNIMADADGVARVKFIDNVISLYPNENFIIGRVLVVHETYDDLGRGSSPLSKLNGNAGGRLACGIIAYK